jgi:membrane protease YdiL (CAAX protease family)
MNPPAPPKQDRTATGFAIGAILTMAVGAVISIAGFLAVAFNASTEPCGQAYGQAALLLIVALPAAALAWYLLFRNKARGFGPGFLRGAVIGVLLVVVVPWPCSYPMGAYINVATCKH